MAVCMHWHQGDQDAPPEVLDLLAFLNPDSTHPQLPAPSSTLAAVSSIGTTTPHDAPSDSSSAADSWPRHAPPSPRPKLREGEPSSLRWMPAPPSTVPLHPFHSAPSPSTPHPSLLHLHFPKGGTPLPRTFPRATPTTSTTPCVCPYPCTLPPHL